jgi:hypothetical protein
VTRDREQRIEAANRSSDHYPIASRRIISLAPAERGFGVDHTGLLTRSRPFHQTKTVCYRFLSIPVSTNQRGIGK